MKHRILLTTITLFSLVEALAQQPARQAYAITAATKGSFVWTEVKLIDLSNGNVVRSVYESKQTNITVTHARTGKPIQLKDPTGNFIDANQQPFSTFSAACAYDKAGNQLFYTPMGIPELRVIKLDKPEATVSYFAGEAFGVAKDLKDEANHITRMAIAVDGQGYALSNDGNHLLKFTTGRKPVITDLGALEDDKANGDVSIHTRPSSWGGDMIADALGNLYVISASHYVFKVDINTRKATFVSRINGLPASFTTNGAAVVADDKLVVSSANSVEGYYEVDMKDWKAMIVPNNGNVYNASDLANGLLAFESKRTLTIPAFIDRQRITNDKIALYPNPVTKGVFRVSFNTEAGSYNVQLVDLSGRLVAQKVVSVSNEGQVAEITVPAKLSKGSYLVKVLNNAKKAVYVDQLLVTTD
ncbi:T9SS type A sorting domain-containing protein [Paraflavitalea sp. CAU 1676]|uniref:T9SS type A sorting domain-containing protein n=1 Tax=Paraflavitalea sp. CAU 1676 TaxID=3032598 RepID=UPI0023DBB357|nr:T9SS type A sorting domain-containing protein [Paraflavitalea sp. CAU 1676]MDF2190039.1 T9SS type A sorting domain-containing protein [Paraflavitalea sp. CAU 1676]